MMSPEVQKLFRRYIKRSSPLGERLFAIHQWVHKAERDFDRTAIPQIDEIVAVLKLNFPPMRGGPKS